MRDIDKLLVNYCKTICKSVKKQYEGTCNPHDWRDYPAVAVVCTDRTGISTRGTNGHVDDAFYNSTLILKKQLMALGRIGGYSRYCNNKIGSCAEPHAAKLMILKHSSPLEWLYFSKARRPRTMEIIPPCKNCRRTFPNL